MTHTSQPRSATSSDHSGDALPSTTSGFLAASTVHDADRAAPFLAEDAVVVDQGATFRGAEQVRAFVRDGGAQFDHTTEPVGARRTDDDHWVVTLRLEGTFPGGTAELDHRSALRAGLISELVIADHGA